MADRSWEGNKGSLVLLAAAVTLVCGAALWRCRSTGEGPNASLEHLRAAMVAGDAGNAERSEAEFAAAIASARAADDVHALQAALHMRGEARLARGDFEGAEADLDQAIALDGTITFDGGVIEPDDARFLAHVDRAIVRLHQGSPAEAREDLDRALDAIPDYAAQRMHYLELQRANGAEWSRQCDTLVATEIVGTDPDAMLAYAQRGACRAWAGDVPGARADFVRSNELRQNPGVLHFFRGVLEQAGGDCRAALADYAEASRLAPAPDARPQHRRSASTRIYGYHAEWFAEAAAGLPGVDPRFAALADNVARCSAARTGDP